MDTLAYIKTDPTPVFTPIEEVAKPKHSITWKTWIAAMAGVAVLAGLPLGSRYFYTQTAEASVVPPQAPSVSVIEPIQRDIGKRAEFLGQFSAVEQGDIRAQVGGTLTEIHFTDGQIVQKGDLLFVIDPTPYEIKLDQADATLESAKARLALANNELARAQDLRRTNAGSQQNVDQKVSEQLAAQAALSSANADVRDAQFDLDHCRVVAPFTGQIGKHLISVGNLVAGSRTGGNAITLLGTLVSIDPIYVNFDMSEADYLAFVRDHGKQGSLGNEVEISLGDESAFTRTGILNFVDNALDRSSGTIHARAIVENKDLLLTPGGFARVRLALSKPAETLLVPDAAVLADQSRHVVYTIGADGTVTPKQVEVGDLRGGLRVIRSGLAQSDKVIIDSIPTIRPGLKVSAAAGTAQFDTAQD